MSGTFSYSSTPRNVVETPIWPDGNQNSKMSQFLIKTKQDNDENYWENMRKIIKNDCENLPMDRYKVWTSIMSVPLMSNHKHSEYIRICLNAAIQQPEYYDALIEPMIGMSEEDHAKFYSMFSDIKTTMNRIQLLGHLLYNNIDSKMISQMDSIVEIGAGAGDLADIIYKLGFKGQYYVYDFPELQTVQKYLHDRTIGENVVNYIQSSDEIKDKKHDLVIATWSLTEMPLELRNEVIENIDSKKWLVAYSKEIFGLDNEKWINDIFIPAMTTKEIIIKDIPWMDWDGGTKYVTAYDNE